MHRPPVEGAEARLAVEVVRGKVADVDRQFEPLSMRAGEVDGVGQDRTPQAATPGGWGEPQVGNLPGVAVGSLGEKQNGRGIGLAPDVTDPPAVGDEPAPRAVARKSAAGASIRAEAGS